MAKKSKKSKRRTASKARAPKATFDRPVTKAKPTTQAATPARSDKVDFREEYRYVLKDLRRLAILAAVMLAVLLVLSAVIT